MSLILWMHNIQFDLIAHIELNIFFLCVCFVSVWSLSSHIFFDTIISEHSFDSSTRGAEILIWNKNDNLRQTTCAGSINWVSIFRLFYFLFSRTKMKKIKNKQRNLWCVCVRSDARCNIQLRSNFNWTHRSQKHIEKKINKIKITNRKTNLIQYFWFRYMYCDCCGCCCCCGWCLLLLLQAPEIINNHCYYQQQPGVYNFRW